MITPYIESGLKESDALYSEDIKAGDGWFFHLNKGQTLRIVDLLGNQSADTLFYNADDIAERYSVQQTLQKQGKVFIGAGTVLYSNDGNPMLEVTADTCGKHDTLGSACSCESNTIRYGFDTRFMHSCRDTYLGQILRNDPRMDKRDLVDNINFFMHVPLDKSGNLNFADGISGPGKYVELKALMNIIVLESNCPQLNNPCNAYNPTPIRMLVWNP